jgi:hypothetical protein
MPVTASETQPAAKISFESYGRLLTLLLPRLRSFAVYDGFANPIWSSADWSADESGEFVRQTISAALQDAGEMPALGRAIDHDRALYCFALRAQNLEILAVVSLEVAIQGKETTPRPVDTLRPFVQPAIDCLRRELELRDALNSIRSTAPAPAPTSATARLRALPVRTHHGADPETLDTILKCGFEYIGCALAALWIPERNVSISLTPSGNRMSPQLLQGPQRQLLDSMQQHQRVITVNHSPTPERASSSAYKTLACPISYPTGRFAGVLALFNPPSGADFQPGHARSAQLLARCISIMISQSRAARGGAAHSIYPRAAIRLIQSRPS